MQSKLNFFGAPYTEAAAVNGIGVIETLKKSITEVISKVNV